MGTFNGATCEELEGSPRFHGDDHGMRATRRWWAPANDDWIKIVKGLMGTHEIESNSVKHTNVRRPLSEDFPNCFCTGYEVDPLLPDALVGNQNGVDYAKILARYNQGYVITAHYDTLFEASATRVRAGISSTLISAAAGTFLNYQQEFGAEIQLTPAATFKWKVLDKPVGQGLQPGIVIPATIHTLTWHPVIKPPFTKIPLIEGAVNSGTFLAAPAGNLLFLGCQPKQIFRFQQGNNPYYTMPYRFAEQAKYLSDGTTAKGWNFLYNEAVSSGEHWQEICNSSNQAPYRSKDFSELFQYEA